MVVNLEVPFPLDGGYLRRQCPCCGRQFKVLLTKEELVSTSRSAIEAYMVQEASPGEEPVEGDDQEANLFCPYCGQAAPVSDWFTDEQVAYVRVIMSNVAARLINEQFLKSLRGMNSSFLKVKTTDVPYEEEWISPEESDMRVVPLPCCGRSVKVLDDWAGPVHCFLCGFRHVERKEHQ